jgi:uncharacterized protein (TIGR03437 family)
MLNRFSRVLFILAAASGITASAQNSASFDTSGDHLLTPNTPYYFRHVLWVVNGGVCSNGVSACGDLGEAQALYGTITFDGNGNYTIAGQLVDANTCTSQGTCPTTAQTITGTYQISASGFGVLDNPLSSSDSIFGLVTNGIFMGSSTENQQGYNDLFIAAPIPSPAPTLSTLNGNYTVMGVDNPSLMSADARDYILTFGANGAGKLSSTNATGYVTAQGGNVTRQSLGTVTYFASGGAFNINFGGTLSDNNLLANTKYVYISPDGNFVFGGSPQGWDMFVGVKTVTGTPNFSGLYYQAGMDLNVLGVLEGSGTSTPDSFYGSFVPLSGNYLLHQRILDVFNGPYDQTADNPLSFNSDGSEDDPYSGQHYVFGNGGAIRIGLGDLQNGVSLGISVAMKAPPFSGSGMFINPTGIQNASNSALFTAGIAPGEIITISGTGFPGPFSNSGLTLNTTLGGTQVLITYDTGTTAPAPVTVAAPLLFVTGNLIAAQIPFEVSGATTAVLAIQVVTHSASSNVVTLFQGLTQPGIYTTTPGGLGDAAVFDAGTFTPINENHKAFPGETLVAYVNGLGTVTPTIADGAPASSTTLSYTDNVITADFFDPVSFNFFDATVAFAGLAPTFAGLYQVNLTVPSGIVSGDLILELYGSDSTGQFVNSYNSQATVPVSGGASATNQASNQAVKRHASRGRRPGTGTRSINHSPRTRKREVPRASSSSQ